MHETTLARALRSGPAGIEAVGGGDSEEPDVAAVLRHQPDRLDRLRRDRARIGNDDLRIRAGLAHPVGAIDDALPQLLAHDTLWLLERSRRQTQIDRATGLVPQPSPLRKCAV